MPGERDHFDLEAAQVDPVAVLDAAVREGPVVEHAAAGEVDHLLVAGHEPRVSPEPTGALLSLGAWAASH